MSIGDKIKNAVQNLTGKAKEATGEVTGDDSRRVEGKADQAGASAKDAVADVKDSASDATDRATD